MYLQIGDKQYTVSKRITQGGQIRYLSVTPTPEAVSGQIGMYTDEGFLLSTDNADAFLRWEYTGTVLTLTDAPEPEPYVPPVLEPIFYASQEEIQAAVQLAKMRMQSAPPTETDDIIRVSALYPDWTPGKHTAKEIFKAHYEDTYQPWEVIQDYDNEVYPDVSPTGSAWRTFHKPYHGKTRQTAQKWIAPSGAHDMYKQGEYMIWQDGTIKRCKQDTNFSPDEYAQAWEEA